MTRLRTVLFSLLPLALPGLALAHPDHDAAHVHPHLFFGVPLWIVATVALVAGILLVTVLVRRLSRRVQAPGAAQRTKAREEHAPS
ncbi:MAG: hypothetical protein V2I63_12110 [Pseudomonadales bacterium]|jgi:hypothetical protein|nr:hypothetical protein [Pseudomonadales bacterium]